MNQVRVEVKYGDVRYYKSKSQSIKDMVELINFTKERYLEYGFRMDEFLATQGIFRFHEIYEM